MMRMEGETGVVLSIEITGQIPILMKIVGQTGFDLWRDDVVDVSVKNLCLNE
jgi:hypothetical protein